MITNPEVQLPLCDACSHCWAAEWRAMRRLTSLPSDACGRCVDCRRGPVARLMASAERFWRGANGDTPESGSQHSR